MGAPVFGREFSRIPTVVTDMSTTTTESTFDVRRLAAFSDNDQGGNPAGVVLADRLPTEADMLRIAHRVGYSETAFLAPSGDGFRVRYFAPEAEVPFCGHATIASAAVLGETHGPGTYQLFLNDGDISVEVGHTASGNFSATLQSPPTSTTDAPGPWLEAMLRHFKLSTDDLDPRFPVRLASAGAKHLVLGLRRRETLAAMSYDFEPVRELMQELDVVTVSLIYPESDTLFHARNAFAFGGVVEDPATGAAAAAFAGYLRDHGRPGPARFTILQGHDMGSPSRLLVEYGATPGESVRVTGETRALVD